MSITDLQSEGLLSECRKNAFALIALCLLVLIPYSNTFRASWHLDDISNITDNRQLRVTGLSFSEFKKAILSSPSPGTVSFHRPVSRLTLALNYYIGENDVLGYHLFNISIHILASIFLYVFIYHTLNLPQAKAKYGPHSYSIALLSSALWAINPVQTQAVTYVVQRMASMAGLFYVMAMYFFVRGRNSQEKHTGRLFFLCSLVAGLLSLGSKENAVLLPVSILLLDLYFVQGITSTNCKRTGKLLFFAFLVPIGISALLISLFTDFLSQVSALYQTRVFTPWERILTEARVIVFYLSILLYPIPSRLSIDHDIPISLSLLDPPSTLLSIVLIIGIIATASYISKRLPLIGFPLLFFFLNHGVESTILPLELVFEHRNYIPSMLLFVPVALGLLRGISVFGHRRRMQFILCAFVVFFLIAQGNGTYLRNLAWKDDKTLWQDCEEKYPESFRAHHNLGLDYHRAGQDLKAAHKYQRALAGRQLHSKKEKGITYFNLGLIAHDRGETEKARHLYMKALELDPCCPGVHTNLGVLLLGLGDKEVNTAIRLFGEGVACKNDSETPRALSNLGILLARKGRQEEGITALQESLTMEPGNVMTLLRSAAVFNEMGRHGTAYTYLASLLRRYPSHPTGMLLLAETLLLGGHTERAREVLSGLAGKMPAGAFASHVQALLQDASPIAVTPDMTLLLPHILDIYGPKLSLPGRIAEKHLDGGYKTTSTKNCKKKEGKNNFPSP